jgi:hypothetical protein
MSQTVAPKPARQDQSRQDRSSAPSSNVRRRRRGKLLQVRPPGRSAARAYRASSHPGQCRAGSAACLLGEMPGTDLRSSDPSGRSGHSVGSTPTPERHKRHGQPPTACLRSSQPAGDLGCHPERTPRAGGRRAAGASPLDPPDCSSAHPTATPPPSRINAPRPSLRIRRPPMVRGKRDPPPLVRH